MVYNHFTWFKLLKSEVLHYFSKVRIRNTFLGKKWLFSEIFRDINNFFRGSFHGIFPQYFTAIIEFFEVLLLMLESFCQDSLQDLIVIMLHIGLQIILALKFIEQNIQIDIQQFICCFSGSNNDSVRPFFPFFYVCFLYYCTSPIISNYNLCSNLFFFNWHQFVVRSQLIENNV